MLQKKKICDKPLTYRLFEKLHTIDAIWLGDIVELRPEWWKWTSRFGGSQGEAPIEVAITKVIKIASKSELIAAVKKRGMRT